MLPGALLCAGHTHRAEPPSVPEAQYWCPPSLPPFSHPENGKRRQALPFPPSGSGFTLPLCCVRGPAEAYRASGLTTSVPCLKLSVAPHQLLHKVRIPRWCPTALGDRPLPASRGPVCPPGLPTPASCPPPVALRVHLACPGPLPGVLCGRPACPRLQAAGSPFVSCGWGQCAAPCCSFSRSSFSLSQPGWPLFAPFAWSLLLCPLCAPPGPVRVPLGPHFLVTLGFPPLLT